MSKYFVVARAVYGTGGNTRMLSLITLLSKWQLRELPFSRRITAKDGVEFVHQLVHQGRMLRQKEKCPAERARGGFKTGHEKDRGLTNQLGVGHAVIFLIAGCHQERQHIVVFLGAAAPFRNRGENFIFDLFGQPQQRVIGRPRKVNGENPNGSGKAASQPSVNKAANGQSLLGVVTEKDRARDLQG